MACDHLFQRSRNLAQQEVRVLEYPQCANVDGYREGNDAHRGAPLFVISLDGEAGDIMDQYNRCEQQKMGGNMPDIKYSAERHQAENIAPLAAGSADREPAQQGDAIEQGQAKGNRIHQPRRGRIL